MAITYLKVPSSASNTDEFLIQPKVNEIIDAVNALVVKVAALQQPAPAPTPPPPTDAVLIDIGAELEAAILAIPVGGRFVLNGPTREIVCEVQG